MKELLFIVFFYFLFFLFVLCNVVELFFYEIGVELELLVIDKVVYGVFFIL